MKSNIIIIMLIAAVLTLMVPLLNQFYNTEQAFTPDNLIKMEAISR
ncbi:MAG: hypothetical protein ABFD08_14930 [Syntrophomonas sp.]